EEVSKTDAVRPVPFRELEGRFPLLRPAVLTGLARQGEIANVIAPSKIGKSWFMYGLALTVANGATWLGQFPATKGRGLLIDNELHPESIVYRVRLVADAMGLAPDDMDVVSLRGRLMDYDSLRERLIDRLSEVELARYAAVVVDAHYRMLPAGIAENDNG